MKTAAEGTLRTAEKTLTSGHQFAPKITTGCLLLRIAVFKNKSNWISEIIPPT